jgi:hypothetical protein
MSKILNKLSKNRANQRTKEESKKADKKFTSYDTRREETSTPQKVREGNEAEGEQQRMKSAKGRKKNL